MTLRTGKRRPLRVIAAGLLLACAPLAWAADEKLSDKERIARLEQLWESQGLAEIVARLQALQQEMQRMHGELEVQAHNLEQLQRSQREAAQDFDRRLRLIEERQERLTSQGSVVAPTLDTTAAMAPAVSDAPLAANAAPTPPASAGVTPPSAPTPDSAESVAPQQPIPETAPGASSLGNPVEPAAPASPSMASRSPSSTAHPSDATAVSPDGGEQTAYQQAFNLLKDGRYDKAIAGFQDFLTRYPNAANAPNAQYWMGEAYYVKRDFKNAQQAFQALLERYPTTAKRPDATLKIGFVHYELGQWNDARKVLSEVQNAYPGTPAAKLAANRLEKMKKEGRGG